MAQQGNINVNGLSIPVWDMQSTAQQIDDTVNAVKEWREDPNNPGCYYHMVDGVQEWINPPMVLGIEYRTVDRFNEKPVYIKLVDCGAMPNSTAKTVEYTNDVNARPISVSGTWSNGTITMPGETGTSNFPNQLQTITLLSRNIYIITRTDLSASTANATVKYWKTSD